MTERIVSAAVTYAGIIFTLPMPARHPQIVHNMSACDLPQGGSQGFLTSTGRYVTRQEAWDIAENANQLMPCAPTGPKGTLFSEDLW